MKPPKVYTFFLGFGSNIGDRREYIDQAFRLLDKRRDITMEDRSRMYETVPVGYLDQALFMNCVGKFQTSLKPSSLLEVTSNIENVLERKRDMRWGPRTIDIDILLYEDMIIQSTSLHIPHPRMHERAFVLEPLVEIAPSQVHPLLLCTMEELLKTTRIREGKDGEKN